MVAQSALSVPTRATPSRPSGSDGSGIAFRLYLLAVFLMPLQLELEQFRGVVESRLPPGDLVLVASILLAPTALRLIRHPLFLLPVFLPVVLAFGMLLAIVQRGDVTPHALRVKFLGAWILVAWCIVTAVYARAGHSRRILRVWVLGMVVWAVVAYIDWRVVDLIPFLKFDEPTRFGGMQFDVNNAGAAYGVAVIVLWRMGGQLFRSTVARTLALATCAAALALTLSRGSYVAVAAAVIVVLAVTRSTAKNWARYAGFVLVVAVVGGATGFLGSAYQDFADRPNTVAEREDLTAEALDSFAASDGLGIGLGSQLADTHARLDVSQQGGGQIVHNTAIWLLVEMSVVGIAYLVAMAVLPIQITLRMRAFDRQLALALLGSHIVMLVASLGIEALYQRQWWMIIGLAMVQPAESMATGVSTHADADWSA
jgi:putative inorganic carbon (hco3(-)) transporter